MESERRRKKRKIKNPKTPVTTLKKRLKSRYWKAGVLVLVICAVIVGGIGYFFFNTPLPKIPDNQQSYEKDNKTIEKVIRDYRNKEN